MQTTPTLTPTSSPPVQTAEPESEARQRLQKLAEAYYRTGMAQIRTAQDIKRYLAETAPPLGGRMRQHKEQTNG